MTCTDRVFGTHNVEGVGAHEHDVGGFDGHVGAGADGDAEVGLREGGGVVDAVPDHGDPAPGRLQLGDLGGLVAGKDLRDHGVDAQLPGDARRGGPVVAGEHDHLDAEVVQRDDRGAEVSRGASAMPMTAAALPSTAAMTAVRPPAANSSRRAASSPRSTPSRSASRRLPTTTRRPSTSATAPWPATFSNRCARTESTPLASA